MDEGEPDPEEVHYASESLENILETFLFEGDEDALVVLQREDKELDTLQHVVMRWPPASRRAWVPGADSVTMPRTEVSGLLRARASPNSTKAIPALDTGNFWRNASWSPNAGDAAKRAFGRPSAPLTREGRPTTPCPSHRVPLMGL